MSASSDHADSVRNLTYKELHVKKVNKMLRINIESRSSNTTTKVVVKELICVKKLKPICLLVLTLYLLLNAEVTCAGSYKLTIRSAIIESQNINIDTDRSRTKQVPKMTRDFLRFQKRPPAKDQDKKTIKLSYYVPFDTTTETTLLVGGPYRVDYGMRTRQETSEMGFYTFSWSSDILYALGLELSELDAIGFLGYRGDSEYSHKTIVPVIIHEDTLPSRINVDTYSFVLDCRVAGRVFVRIRDIKSDSVLFTSEFDHAYSGPALVQWHLRDDSSSAIPEGFLRLSVSLQPKHSREVVVQEYSFYHKNTLSTENATQVKGRRLEGRYEEEL